MSSTLGQLETFESETAADSALEGATPIAESLPPSREPNCTPSETALILVASAPHFTHQRSIK
ncbi:hypothetical protein LX90_000493 [Lentzea flava]|nr:hypothetical protein [Lentzea flava]